MKLDSAGYPNSVIFDGAPSLEILRRLSPETKDRLLLARLARLGRMDSNSLNKHNLMLPDDPYQLAYGYGVMEKSSVREHLLGLTWTRLVNAGFLADYRGQGTFVVTEEGKKFLEIQEESDSKEENSLNLFGTTARKRFDLKVENLYQSSVIKARDLKHQYQNEGIASGGRYLQKIIDMLTRDFRGVEAAFVESFLERFPQASLSGVGRSWLSNSVDEIIGLELTRLKETFALVASSFVSASVSSSSVYLPQLDESGRSTKARLLVEIDLLMADGGSKFSPQSPTRKPEAKRPAWLPSQWKMMRSLSEGGQGWTYLVSQENGEGSSTYVLKRLKNQNRAERFFAEIKALKLLSHPGILEILDEGEAGGRSYYVAEYCESGDLSHWKHESFTLLEKLRLFRQIADAMSAAHAARIIHRDLKPFNILMRLNREMVVGDFGLCIHLNDQDGRLTSLNEAVGPRNYMAPELEDGRIQDPEPSADVYSLGKLLYFMVAGKCFSREKHRDSPFDLLHPVGGIVEPGIHFVYELFDRSIVFDPKDRYPDATALKSALDGVIMKIEGNANVLNLNVRQRCLYCLDGHYRIMQGASPDQHNLKLVCSNCGNFQQFISQNTTAKDWWSSR